MKTENIIVKWKLENYKKKTTKQRLYNPLNIVFIKNMIINKLRTRHMISQQSYTNVRVNLAKKSYLAFETKIRDPFESFQQGRDIWLRYSMEIGYTDYVKLGQVRLDKTGF